MAMAKDPEVEEEATPGKQPQAAQGSSLLSRALEGARAVGSHVGEAAGEVLKEPLGPGPESVSWLQRRGWYRNPGDEGWRAMVQSFNESIIRPLLQSGDLVLRGGQLVLKSTGAAVSETARQAFGLSQGEAARMERDLVGLGETALLLGTTAPPAVRLPRGQRPPLPEGMLAQAAKVAEASKTDDVLKFTEEMLKLAAEQEKTSERIGQATRALAEFSANRKNTGLLLQAGKEMNISEVMNYIRTLGDDPQKVAKFVAYAQRPGLADKVYEFWINSILSGPATHASNLMSNTLTSVWGMGEKWTTAAISQTAGSGAVSFKEALAHTMGSWEGIKDGTRAALKSLAGEADVGKLDVRHPQAIGGRLGKVIRTPGQALEVEDRLFKGIAYRQDINAGAVRQALSEGIQDGKQLASRIAELKLSPTEDMIEHARAFALQQTFQAAPGQIGQSFLQFRNAIPGARYVLPFVRTPANIIKYAAERTPASLLFKKTQAALAAGGAARDAEMAKMSMGSMIATTVAAYAAEDMITGGGPKDPKERALMYAKGWQPYSVKVGDTYYSYNRLEPLGMILGLTADAMELGKKLPEQELNEAAVLITGSIAQNLTSKTYLRGLSDFMEMLNDPERYGGRFLQGMAGSMVPTGLAQFARAEDPYLREARTVLDKLKERTPGYKETLPLKRDVFGEPIQYEGTFIERLMSPIYRRTMKKEPVVDELLRLDLGAPRVMPRIKGVELSPEQHDVYRREFGQRFRSYMDGLIRNQRYRELNDDQKGKAIQGVSGRARDEARDAVFKAFPQLTGKAEKRKEELPRVPWTLKKFPGAEGGPEAPSR